MDNLTTDIFSTLSCDSTTCDGIAPAHCIGTGEYTNPRGMKVALELQKAGIAKLFISPTSALYIVLRRDAAAFAAKAEWAELYIQHDLAIVEA